MDATRIFNNLLTLADSINEYLPMPGVSQLGIDLGKKVVGMIDDVLPHVPLDQQQAAYARRKALADSVEVKVRAEARKLRG
jgi:hypothetical protein